MRYQHFASSSFECLKGVWIFKMFIKISYVTAEDEVFKNRTYPSTMSAG